MPPLTSQQGQHPYHVLPSPPSWELRKRRDKEHWWHWPPSAQGLPTVCHGVTHAPQICLEYMEPRSPRFNPCPLMPFPQGCRQALSRPLPVNPSPLPCLQPGQGHVPVSELPHLAPLPSFARKYFCFMTNSAPHFSRVILMN